MSYHRSMAFVVLPLLVVGLLACAEPSPSPSPSASRGDPLACVSPPAQTTPIAAAKLYVEYNATDGDLGVHGAFDDHGWSELCVYDPSDSLVLVIQPQGSLKGLSLAGIFFESREPPTEEFALVDLKARFPEGQYTLRATNADGTGLSGAATFTHAIPNPPTITQPRLALDEEATSEVVVPLTDLTVAWEDVTETVEGAAVAITGYEVIITKVEHEDPHGYSRPVFDVHLPPDRNRLSIAPEFLEPGTLYELELLALEESGNQTITVGFFTTE